ncbi:DEAD/DEAH box helicase [Sphingobacterium arenae]|uniref:DEAD/DEAH box helicase n=1 Tax=Sphingobacterium arenae TaxID=1280598 RepID=A0ABR7Y498_9SPHI|nr:DEAD/DEAH box helicase [Sphingobacterium arenae]MBD1426128.1 DEAD/DEAH box helicase [Sphingobacterium arenae]
MDFKNIGLIAPLLKAIDGLGHTAPTDIQKQSIPYILEGKNIIGCAQTGTGKTGAFAIPLLHLLATEQHSGKKPRALIVVPTRELAVQIDQSFAGYGKYLHIEHMVIYGGVSQAKQVSRLQKGVDILVATPGRLLDLMNQGHVDLSAVRRLILDEADNMLDMGFVNDIKKILKRMPAQKQTLLFSATMPKAIRKFAGEILDQPVEVTVSPISSTSEKVSQSVFFINKNQKTKRLTKMLLDKKNIQTLIFMRTKHGADRLAKSLGRSGVQTACIHGNKSQNARENALLSFKNGKINVFIATDIASRGIDIKELPQVINYDLPADSETYVHRIGRTGRAGNEGKAVSFCSEDERPMLAKIQKLIGFQVPIAQ